MAHHRNYSIEFKRQVVIGKLGLTEKVQFLGFDAAIANQIAMGRRGLPSEIANAALF
jgi:hypothetical protein